MQLFGVAPEDIIGTTTDAATVCESYGREMGINHQLCYDHGVHNAIQRVIYKKVDGSKEKQRLSCSRQVPEQPEYDDSEEMVMEEALFNDEEDIDKLFELQIDIGLKVNQVREIVKLFRKSPKLNDILQAIISNDRGNKLQLQLDVRTRWGSMLDMLETFTKVSGSIKKALTEIGKLELWYEDIPLSIKGTLEVLRIAKMTMDSISRDDATLLSAEGAFEFMFIELERIDSSVSLELLKEVKVELNKRRQKDIVSLLKFLQDPDSLKESQLSYFSMPPKNEVFATACAIWGKYFQANTHIDDQSQEPQQQDPETEEDSLEADSIQARLGMAIGKRTASPHASSSDENGFDDKAIKLACKNYVSTKIKHPCLQQMHDALLLIKPTSIKNEQNFSMSSNFLSKNRKKMLCGTLDDLCFLKSHFCGLKKK